LSTNQQFLVTGGTGFVGSYIIKNLVEKGHRVRAIRRSKKLPFYISKEISNKIEWVNEDILDIISLQDAMRDVDVVIHSAAIVSFSKHDRSRMYQVNVEGTNNVVNAAIDTATKRLLHVSSVAALGRTTKEETVTEKKNGRKIKTIRITLSQNTMLKWLYGEDLQKVSRELSSTRAQCLVMATGISRVARFSKTHTVSFHGIQME